MASRKEEKEALRKAREQAEAGDRGQERKRLIFGYAVAGLITLAVVAGIVAVIVGGGDSGPGGDIDAGENDRVNVTFGVVPEGVEVDDRTSTEVAPLGTDAVGGDVTAVKDLAEAANCELFTDQKDEGNNHIPLSEGVPDYEANPPTSGNHFQNPLADGAFIETPSPVYYLHALEHGRVGIQYHSDLPEGEQLQLLGVYDESRPGVTIFPDDDQPYAVAATAWRNTLGCDSFEGEATLQAIQGFREAFRARGPEPVAIQ